MLQSAECQSCLQELTPGGHQHFDRLRGTAHQDVGGKHRADADLTVDCQQRSRAQRQGLLAVAHELHQRGDAVSNVVRGLLRVQVLEVALLPTPSQVAEHAHGLHHFGVAEFGAQELVDLDLGFRGRFGES